MGFAILGLLLPFTKGKQVRAYLAVSAAAFFYVISSYPFWDGLSSYGNRFFISLTPVFAFGLAHLLEELGLLFRHRLAYATQRIALALFVLWNLGFIFQWGTHMVPARGKISWSAMVHNQVTKVPQEMARSLDSYFTHRGELMQHHRAGRYRAEKTTEIRQGE